MDPVGHFSVALAASAVARPKAPVWVLGLATAVPDALFFGCEALGWEHKAKTTLTVKDGLKYQKPATIYLSHGLFMTLIWSVLVAAIAWPFYRDLWTSVIVGLMVLSHWVLDALVYNNMPLFLKDSREVGLSLITSAPGFVAGIILEIVIVAGGIALFFFACGRATRP